MTLNVVILAAGQGTRMQSSQAKVLHKLAGQPLIEHIITTAESLEPEKIIIVHGHAGDQVKATMPSRRLEWVEQSESLGTGHAVQQALPYIDSDARVLVLVADIPLIKAETLRQFVNDTSTDSLGVIVTIMQQPQGLGRIIRDKDNQITAIIEEKDASKAQKEISEVNSGIILAPVAKLKQWLAEINNNNAQGEYYLTDVFALAVAEDYPRCSSCVADAMEVFGINNRAQLAQAERYFQYRQVQTMMQKGLGVLDPQRFDLRGALDFGKDVVIDVNVVIEGKVYIGANSRIGPNTVLRNCKIADNVVVRSHCVIEDANIANNCIVGPFARIRPGTELAAEVHIGNFVEIKKSKIDQASKINHLSYIGDSEVGKAVNVGAGTITCNYDGVNKHRTKIADGVSVGSNTSLVAPIEIGAGATIGAGSTLRKNAPAGGLVVCKTEQRVVEGWQRPDKRTKD